MVDKAAVMETAEGLHEFQPRLWENESDAAAFLEKRIARHNVDVHSQEYYVTYPNYPTHTVKADGAEIDCLPSGFESGEIGKTLVDSINVDERVYSEANINFNPECPAISVASWYDAPAVAVARQDVPTLLQADEVQGRLEVEWESFTSRNLLVGNREDPEHVIFTHYDSFWGGFIDNAFSAALLAEMVGELSLNRSLIVFAGSEEISDDDPYWCYGYRQFEAEYLDLLQNCTKISVVDGVGRGEVKVTRDKELLEPALNIDNGGQLWDKTELLTTPFKDIADIYHSPIDTPDKARNAEGAIQTVKETFSE